MKITPRNPELAGIFIAVEGIDGAGKTAAVGYLAQQIRDAFPNREVVVFRAPGGTEVGEKIRNILLHEEMSKRTELLLFVASHNETIEKVILPALKRGAIVLTDRFLDSTYAYQGYGRELITQVIALHQSLLCGFEPDHVVYVEADQTVANKRLGERGDMNRLDALESAIKQRIAQGMSDRRDLRQEHDPNRVSVIENNDGLDKLELKCQQFVNDHLLRLNIETDVTA